MTYSKSKDKDQVRREFILNVILVGSVLLSFIASVSAVVGDILNPHLTKQSPYVLIILLFFLVNYYLSRIGKAKWVIYILISLYLTVTTYSSSIWGADLPQNLLIYALIIIMAGILVNSLFAFVVTFIVSILIISLIYLQSAGIVPVNLSWRSDQAMVRDGIVYSVTFFIIALVSWLFNREMEKALIRARASEAALMKQRNQLGVMVEERTRQLKQVQSEKMIQLYRFAEFGRSASGMFHELTNPLTLISLNLNKLTKSSMSGQNLSETEVALNRAIIGTKKLESFIKAARRQIQNEQVNRNFSLLEEISLAMQILEYRAKKAQIKMLLYAPRDIRILGDPIKFSQVVTNLISNAIDSYDGVTRKVKLIEVRLQKSNGDIRLEVEDFGSGIRKKDLPYIFESLFTTKSFEKGMGVGLSICKDIVEKYFRGKINVITKGGKGTTFTVEFPVTR